MIKFSKSIKLLMILSVLIASIFTGCSRETDKTAQLSPETTILLGWSSTDITPDQPVDLRGQFPARISEGVLDPVTATVLVIESPSSESAVLISCDMVSVGKEMIEGVRNKLEASLPELDTEKIIMNATHTHTAPLCGEEDDTKSKYGIALDVMAPSAYLEFMTEKMAVAVKDAWTGRQPGGISFGLGHAVVGHNRLQVDYAGKSVMYGNTNREEFSHIEGYEDHSVNLLYTWDINGNLTGTVINIACPSQATESMYKISADFWHDTRQELRKRLGNELFILPQASAAGDQSPHLMTCGAAEYRMQKLMGVDSLQIGRGKMGRRQQIAVRIADAVTSVLPYMKDNIEWNPKISYQREIVELSRRLISMEDVNKAVNESKQWEEKYNQLLKEIEENPEIKNQPRWYSNITNTYRRLARGKSVKERYELEKVQPRMPVEINVLRIGDIVMATNPFELYLDYGMRMKARSPAIQTFLIQLSNGSYGYLPPYRSTVGGSYGAEPASTLIGPEGGRELVEKTLELINRSMQ